MIRYYNIRVQDWALFVTTEGLTRLIRNYLASPYEKSEGLISMMCPRISHHLVDLQSPMLVQVQQ